MAKQEMIMIDYMAHSDRKPHYWKIRKAWFRQFLIAHRWGLRGAYSSKYFGGHEYMMTKAGEQGENYIVCIRRKEDFWAVVSREDRDREAKEKRKTFCCIVNTSEDGGPT
jgi:hypothetical protein